MWVKNSRVGQKNPNKQTNKQKLATACCMKNLQGKRKEANISRI